MYDTINLTLRGPCHATDGPLSCVRYARYLTRASGKQIAYAATSACARVAQQEPSALVGWKVDVQPHEYCSLGAEQSLDGGAGRAVSAYCLACVASRTDRRTTPLRRLGDGCERAVSTCRRGGMSTVQYSRSSAALCIPSSLRVSGAWVPYAGEGPRGDACNTSSAIIPTQELADVGYGR